MKLNLPLLALAVAAFAIGTTEFAPMGLLPDIAAGVRVSIPTAGLLVSGYAIGVVVGAPLMTLTTGRLSRKVLLVGLLTLFTLSNLAAAAAPSYGTLFVARVATSFCHGPFFGVGAVLAASLAPKDKRAGAIATMLMGLTIANVGGVPAASAIGHYIGWRAAFLGIAALGLASLVALQLALPKSGGAPTGDVRAELGVMRRPEVLLALLTTILASAAMFTVFTYIAPILRDVTGVSPSVITAMLVVYGSGLTVGNYLGGRFADRALRPTMIVVLILLALLLLAFTLTMHSRLLAGPTIFAWGVATFALVAPLQIRVMQVAAEAPTLASAVNVGAFNLGNAIGAALGAGLIQFGLEWLPAAGAALAGVGLLVVLASRWEPAPA